MIAREDHMITRGITRDDHDRGSQSQGSGYGSHSSDSTYCRAHQRETLNSSLALCTRDSVSYCHRSMLYPTERFSLMLGFLGQPFYQTMLLYGGYKPQRIHKGGKLMLFSLTGLRWKVYYLNFVRAHTPKQCKHHKCEQCHFNLIGSASVCTRRFLSAPVPGQCQSCSRMSICTHLRSRVRSSCVRCTEDRVARGRGTGSRLEDREERRFLTMEDGEDSDFPLSPCSAGLD